MRYADVSEGAGQVATSPERIAGQRLVWRGEVEQARAVLTRLQQQADVRGEPSSYALVRLHICELEIRVGDWVAAGRLLDDWAATADDELLVWPMYERCRALVHAGTGASDEARRWAGEALGRADATGVRWDQLEAQRALGLADLLDGQPQAAADRLRTVWEHTVRSGVGDPGAFPVAPDLVEALAWVGAHDEARDVTERLTELGDQLDHPWARVSGRRCAAAIALAEAGYDEQAGALLGDAAAEYSRLGLRFDRARTLLGLGIAQRRAKKWGLGRDTLEDAVGAFDELGSSGWARVARDELARVGARRPAAAGELTPMERKVADLAVQGLSNKEIARSLVVTVNTVEFHLRNTYTKLGHPFSSADRRAARRRRRDGTRGSVAPGPEPAPTVPAANNPQVFRSFADPRERPIVEGNAGGCTRPGTTPTNPTNPNDPTTPTTPTKWSSTMHDVVIVGARAAGAATALLLARLGHDVVLLDRADFPSDTLSTHQLARPGVVQLARWGLLTRCWPVARQPSARRTSPPFGETISRTIKEYAGVDLLVARVDTSSTPSSSRPPPGRVPRYGPGSPSRASATHRTAGSSASRDTVAPGHRSGSRPGTSSARTG